MPRAILGNTSASRRRGRNSMTLIRPPSTANTSPVRSPEVLSVGLLNNRIRLLRAALSRLGAPSSAASEIIRVRHPKPGLPLVVKYIVERQLASAVGHDLAVNGHGYRNFRADKGLALRTCVSVSIAVLPVQSHGDTVKKYRRRVEMYRELRSSYETAKTWFHGISAYSRTSWLYETGNGGE